MNDPYEILVKPVITEKAMSLQARGEPQYTFRVHVASNKREIKKAVERKCTKLPNPTPANAALPNTPTMAVSTRLRTFWLVIPPMMGRASPRIRWRRCPD